MKIYEDEEEFKKAKEKLENEINSDPTKEDYNYVKNKINWIIYNKDDNNDTKEKNYELLKDSEKLFYIAEPKDTIEGRPQLIENKKRTIVMLRKISTADARKKLANIVNRVAFGKEAFVLTRRGEALAALVSVEDLKLLQEIEERIDVEDAWKVRSESEETVSWEELKKELDL